MAPEADDVHRPYWDALAGDVADSPGLRRVAVALPLTARRGPEGAEIDERALNFAILMAGSVGRNNTAQWLYEWLVRHAGLTTVPALDTAPERAARVTVSPALRETILPRAREMARCTVQRDLCDLRHLAFALLERPSAAWAEVVPGGLDDERAVALARHLVARIAAHPEPGESVATWEKLVAAPTGLRTLGDDPATVDQLDRAAFARVLASRIREARDPAQAFVVHLHGAWGSGKSSLLNLLGEDLEANGGWLVVRFNAWQHHRLRPPWWWLVTAIYRCASDGGRGRGLGHAWWWHWLRTDSRPLLALATVLAAATAALGSSWLAAGVMVAGGAAVYAHARLLRFGTAKAADVHAELVTDGYRPVLALYSTLIRRIGCPVVVFIDDLDRCDAAFVVELIEGMQTLLRGAPVTFVIAGDRAWFCTAFEKRYAEFAPAIGEPGRPLGYLFLDKMFQLSTGMPALGGDRRRAYWRSLLGPAAASTPAISPAAAAARVEGMHTLTSLQGAIAAAAPADRRAVREAAAQQITSLAATRTTEHLLAGLADLVEANPRAMKRLVNAVGMAQARLLLEERDVPLELLARWTLLELRWPVLATYLAATLGRTTQHPPPIDTLLADPLVRRVCAGLDPDALEALVG